EALVDRVDLLARELLEGGALFLAGERGTKGERRRAPRRGPQENTPVHITPYTGSKCEQFGLSRSPLLRRASRAPGGGEMTLSQFSPRFRSTSAPSRSRRPSASSGAVPPGSRPCRCAPRRRERRCPASAGPGRCRRPAGSCGGPTSPG